MSLYSPEFVMYKRSIEPWPDLRDLDRPGSFGKECKSLLDQILQFSFYEAPIYGQASEEDVEKQDVSYRLLEEENFVLKSQILSLQDTVQLKENEIVELKRSIRQLQCKKQTKKLRAELEEISLPDVGQLIRRINSTVGNILDENVVEQLRNTTMKKNTISESETTESLTVSDNNLTISSNSLSLLTDETNSQSLNVIEPTVSGNTVDDTLPQSRENETGSFSENSKENKLATIEEKYFSVKRENLTLENKIKVLTNKITLLKSSLTSCELELIEYDKILTLIKKERYNMIVELRRTKHSYNSLKQRNEYLEEKVSELENQLKSEFFEPEKSTLSEDGEFKQYEVLNCYKNRLYEAFKEMSDKEEQIEHLNDSINGLVEKYKTEKNLLEMECADRLKEFEERLKQLCDDKLKLEETIRQQSKLIDHLQGLVETKDKKPGSKINCLKES